MMFRRAISLFPFFAFTLLAPTLAQLLANGNGQLPSCASSCAYLNQAAQACGGTTAISQAIWNCFCQSGYLRTLYTTPTGICDNVCTNPADNQQVMTWYQRNCGTDNGASEHPDSATTVVVTTTSASTTATATATNSGAALPTTTSSAGEVTSSGNTSNSDWWRLHYKWVIMLIVLFLGLLLIALLAFFLKRRHERKQDQIREGFNAGITTRSTPAMTTVGSGTASTRAGDSTLMTGALDSGSGRNSPVRTRDAFMPYGYGYARSESRLASRTDVGEGRKSPMVMRGTTPVDQLEKQTGVTAGAGPTPPQRNARRVLVRESSMAGPESPLAER